MDGTIENVKLVRAFIEFKAREGKSRRTIQSYSLKLASFLEHIDPQPIDSLAVDALEGWLDRPRLKRCAAGRASLATIRNESAILRSAFKFWSVRDLVPRNTAALLGNVDKPRRQPKPADQKLVRLLLGQPLPLEERFVFEAMHHLGLRREEVCRLRPSSFDTTNGLVTIEGKGAKERVIEYADLLAWQQAKGYAVGAFTQTLSALLDARRDRLACDSYGRAQEAHMVPWGDHSRSAFAPMADPQEVNKRLNRWLVAADTKAGSITPHQFRHAFGTWMLRHGMDVVLVSALMGHSSLAVTQGYLDLGSQPVRDLLRRELREFNR